jgi:hypothetical protein
MNRDQARAIARESREREVVTKAVSDGKADRGTGRSSAYQPPSVPVNTGASNTDTLAFIVSCGVSSLFPAIDPPPNPSEIAEKTQLKELYDAAYIEAKKSF